MLDKLVDKIEVVEKVDLLDGEEHNDLPRKIMHAMTQQKAKLQKSLYLTHIFKDHIIAMDWETRKRFRMDMSRDAKGAIKLGKPVEVVATFVPAKKRVEKSEDANPIEIKTAEAEDGSVILVKSKLEKDELDRITTFIDKCVNGTPEVEIVDVPKENFWRGAFSPK